MVALSPLFCVGWCARGFVCATAVRGCGGMQGGREGRSHVSFPGGLHQLLRQGRSFALPSISVVTIQSCRGKGVRGWEGGGGVPYPIRGRLSDLAPPILSFHDSSLLHCFVVLLPPLLGFV